MSICVLEEFLLYSVWLLQPSKSQYTTILTIHCLKQQEDQCLQHAVSLYKHTHTLSQFRAALLYLLSLSVDPNTHYSEPEELSYQHPIRFYRSWEKLTVPQMHQLSQDTRLTCLQAKRFIKWEWDKHSAIYQRLPVHVLTCIHVRKDSCAAE